MTVPNDSAGQATANRVFSRAQPQQLSRVLAGPRLSRSTFARSSRLELFHAWLGKEEERRKAVATRLKGSYSASESPSFLSLCAEGCRQRDDVGGAAESIAIRSLLSIPQPAYLSTLPTQHTHTHTQREKRSAARARHRKREEKRPKTKQKKEGERVSPPRLRVGIVRQRGPSSTITTVRALTSRPHPKTPSSFPPLSAQPSPFPLIIALLGWA